MLQGIRFAIARFIAPEYEDTNYDEWHEIKKREKILAYKEREVDERVNQRVADFLLTMDPFEPLLKKYHVIFSEDYPRPEDKLAPQSQFEFLRWAFYLEQEVHFKYLNDWIRNVQGNATLRQAKNDPEWFFGRAMLACVTLYIREVSRLSSRYKDILAKRDGSFDAFLPVEE